MTRHNRFPTTAPSTPRATRVTITAPPKCPGRRAHPPQHCEREAGHIGPHAHYDIPTHTYQPFTAEART